ncbi:MAG: Rieske (2Fe-2S) protein [Jiangellaceae bacterium]
MTDHDMTPIDATPAELRRRVVLLGAGAVGVSGLLAACGGGDDAPGAGGGDPTTGGAPETSPSAPSQPPSAQPTEGSGGTPLTTTAEVPVGGGVVITGEQVVVTQPTEGDFKAFSSTCTHQGCQVARVEDSQIQCPCHGSRYSVADGSVEAGPAPAPLPEVTIAVEGDQILLT